MGKISRIQLRGISRTPSDRLTEDGGCAESLNVQLDNTELAPSFIPEDVTKKLGLPEDLQAEKVFVHKTASYTNYIVVQKDKVVAYSSDSKDGEPLRILDREEDLQVTEIASIGNTVIIYTEEGSNYLLFQDGAYRNLGTNIPFPTIEFFDARTPFEEKVYSRGLENNNIEKPEVSYINNPPMTSDKESAARGVSVLYWYYLSSWDQEALALATLLIYLSYGLTYWSDYSDPIDEENIIKAKGKIRAEIISEINSMVDYNARKGIFSYPIWALYAVKLYDGTRIISCPQLVSPGFDAPFDINLCSARRKADSDKTDVVHIDICANNLYRLGIRMHGNVNFDDWKDIVESVEIYISDDINAPSLESIKPTEVTAMKLPSSSDIAEMYVAKMEGEKKNAFREEALQHSVFAKVEEFGIKTETIQNISLIEKDFICDAKSYIKGEDRFSGRTLLSDTKYRMRDYEVIPKKVTVYNKSALFSDVERKYFSGPSWLSCQRYNTILPWVLRTEWLDAGIDPAEFPRFYFLDRTITAFNKGCYYNFAYIFNDGGIVHGRSGESGMFLPIERYDDLSPAVYDLIMFPSLSCTETQWMTIDGEERKLSSAKMFSHPTFPNLSYSFGGKWLGGHEGYANKNLPTPNPGLTKDLLYKSEPNNPFFISSVYEFDSRIIGVATATAALSQGQFGQFPLYVFTEDGIWAMETAADGSFVTSKPLSRDVCVNTKSITSIDNAVVFVSAQGVMLLQGSQVTNISPYMNGKHYVVENTAQSIIEGQDFFCDLLPAISDKTHFLAFVKEASVAYDYAGKRLVFIKDDEEYQYVYKLDTQTWHKVAYGINMQAPVNSYPECLVQGKGGVPMLRTMCHVVTNTNKDGREYLVNYIKEYFFIELTEEQINAFLNGEYDIDVTHCEDSMKEQFFIAMSERAVDIAFEERIVTMECTRIYDLSTILDTQESRTPTRGIIATRPFDLDEPDIFKTITDVRIRGQFPKGAVRFILLGSNDGINFYTLSTLRGRSWKLFRMILLADLAPTDRISWVDVQYETKFTNRLR